MLKKLFIILLILAAVAAITIYLYRYQILTYSADAFIRGRLPEYVRIDKINFDARGSRVVLNGFKIINPPGFSNEYILEIEELSCKYKLKGADIAGGFEVFDPVFKRCLLNIERLSDGRLNLIEMGPIVKKETAEESAPQDGSASPSQKSDEPAGTSKLSNFVKLPEKYALRDSKIVFLDRYRVPKPHIVTFENVNSDITIRLNDDYTGILRLDSQGQGNVNGRAPEVVRWYISLDPTTPKLTMSNRFEVSDVEIKPFEPYYYKFSPIVFTGGTFSGLLIFDFNNGDIGSSNEIRLRDIRFYVKPGYENAGFWDTTVPDIVKYFATPYGEVVFDFKIKGDMQNPQFYLGPKSKAALTSLAIDKISTTIQKMSQEGQKPSEAAKGGVGKVKEYIDLFRELSEKK